MLRPVPYIDDDDREPSEADIQADNELAELLAVQRFREQEPWQKQRDRGI